MISYLQLSRWYSGKESTCQCRRFKRHWFNPLVRKSHWSRKKQLVSVFLPGKFHGKRSLVGYSPQGHKESDTTETTQHAFICLQLFLLLIAISYILVISPIPAFCPGKTKYSVKIFITVKVDPLTFPKGNISRNH